MDFRCPHDLGAATNREVIMINIRSESLWPLSVAVDTGGFAKTFVKVCVLSLAHIHVPFWSIGFCHRIKTSTRPIRSSCRGLCICSCDCFCSCSCFCCSFCTGSCSCVGSCACLFRGTLVCGCCSRYQVEVQCYTSCGRVHRVGTTLSQDSSHMSLCSHVV